MSFLNIYEELRWMPWIRSVFFVYLAKRGITLDPNPSLDAWVFLWILLCVASSAYWLFKGNDKNERLKSKKFQTWLVCWQRGGFLFSQTNLQDLIKIKNSNKALLHMSTFFVVVLIKLIEMFHKSSQTPIILHN